MDHDNLNEGVSAPTHSPGASSIVVASYRIRKCGHVRPSCVLLCISQVYSHPGLCQISHDYSEYHHSMHPIFHQSRLSSPSHVIPIFLPLLPSSFPPFSSPPLLYFTFFSGSIFFSALTSEFLVSCFDNLRFLDLSVQFFFFTSIDFLSSQSPFLSIHRAPFLFVFIFIVLVLFSSFPLPLLFLFSSSPLVLIFHSFPSSSFSSSLP